MTQHSKNIGTQGQKKAGKSHWTKGSKYYQVAQNQQWFCPICGESILSEGNQKIHTHHIIPVSSGGENDIHNLTHVHRACHKQVHSEKSKLKGAYVRSRPCECESLTHGS